MTNRRRGHRISDVCFAEGRVCCSCGFSATVPEEESRELHDQAVRDAYADHLRRVRVKTGVTE